MNNGGSRKTISSAYANIGGSRKQIHPYSTSTIYYVYPINNWTYKTMNTEVQRDWGNDGTIYSSFSFNSSTGKFTLSGTGYRDLGNGSITGYYLDSGNSTASTIMYYTNKNYGIDSYGNDKTVFTKVYYRYPVSHSSSYSSTTTTYYGNLYDGRTTINGYTYYYDYRERNPLDDSYYIQIPNYASNYYSS